MKSIPIIAAMLLSCLLSNDCFSQGGEKSFPCNLRVLDSQTGSPVFGVSVSVSSQGKNVPVRTLGEGRSRYYQVTLSPGRFTLTVSKAGYKSYSFSSTLPPQGPKGVLDVRLVQASVQPKPGTQPAAGKAIVYHLRLVDATTNADVAGVRAYFTGPGGKTVKAQEVREGRSRLYLATLPLGRHFVSYSKPGYKTQTETVTIGPRDAAGTRTIRLASATQAGNPKQAGNPRKGGMPKPAAGTFHFSLNVIDSPTRKFLPGANVTIAIGDARLTAKEYPRDFVYVFETLRPGQYRVSVGKAGYTSQLVTITVKPGPTGNSTTVTLKPTGPAPVAANLLWIRVVDDKTDKPIDSPTVQVTTGDARFAPKRVQEWFQYELKPGKYTLAISKDGYVAQQVVVAMGTDKNIQRIRLKPATTKPVPPAGVAFQVRVLDDLDSKPLSGATVAIQAAGPRGATFTANEQRGFNNYGTTLAAGRYKVTISKRGYVSQTIDATVFRERIRAIPAIRLKRLRTTPTLITLWLQAIDDVTGAVIPAPTIAVTSGTDNEKIGTSKDWYYAQVESGSYKVAIAKTGYTSREVTVRVGSETVTRKIRLKRLTTPKPPTTPSYTLKIRVEDERGTLIRSPFVLLKSGTDTLRSTLQGGYYASRVTPGTYKVTVTKTGYTPEEVTVAIRESDITRRIILKRISTPEPPKPPVGKLALTIAVIDIKSKAIVGAKVTVTTPANAASFVESAGTHKADGLKSGAYSVTISKTGYTTETRDYTLGLTSRKATVVLRRVAPSEFVLRVAGLDESKSPILSFRASGGPGINVESDRQRYYSTKLKPGTYQVEFKKTGYETVTRVVTIRDADEKLDVDLKPIKKVVTPTRPSDPQAKRGGVSLKSRKQTVIPRSGTSRGGVRIKKSGRSTIPVGNTSPGGVRLTITKRATPPDQKPDDTRKTPVDTPDNGTLVITRKT